MADHGAGRLVAEAPADLGIRGDAANQIGDVGHRRKQRAVGDIADGELERIDRDDDAARLEIVFAAIARAPSKKKTSLSPCSRRR